MQMDGAAKPECNVIRYKLAAIVEVAIARSRLGYGEFRPDSGIITSAATSRVGGLFAPKKRAEWYDPTDALEHAGGLRDTVAGRRKYGDYLAWLSEDELARKKLRFEEMSKGWVIGTKQFRKAMYKEHRELSARRELGVDDAAEAREGALQELLRELVGKLGRSRADLRSEGKFVAWKLAVAAAMKSRTTVTNRWLSENLAMGSLHEVSRQVSTWSRDPDAQLSKKLR